MRVERLQPGRPAPAALADGVLVGAVLARDLTVDGDRWSKGRRLSEADLACLASPSASVSPPGAVSVLVLEAGDVHEDDAGLRLAALVAGEGLTVRGPSESRVDLLASVAGVLHVRTDQLERLNRIDPLEVFTAFDGSVVSKGALVTSVKVAPHTVGIGALEAAERQLRGRPLVWVAPFIPRRVGVVVKESIHAPARDRFERSVRSKIESLGSSVVSIEYVEDDDVAVEKAMRPLVLRGSGVDLILTAGGGSTDPADPFFVALDRLGGRVVRRGVPAHPGSMLWMGRIGRTAILGLPTCGAYSKATAADLLLPRLLSGEPASPRTVAKLGHGGILTRDQRFRFPAYARELEAPEG